MERIPPPGILVLAFWAFFAAALNGWGYANRARDARQLGYPWWVFRWSMMQFALYAIALTILGYGLLTLDPWLGFWWGQIIGAVFLANLAAPILRGEAMSWKMRLGKAFIPIAMMLLLVVRYRYFFGEH